MTDSAKAPSKGALAAAQLVAGEYERARHFGRMASPLHDKLAEIIDRETKAGEMAEALQELMTLILNGSQVYGAKQLQWITQKPVWGKCECLLTELEGKL